MTSLAATFYEFPHGLFVAGWITVLSWGLLSLCCMAIGAARRRARIPGVIGAAGALMGGLVSAVFLAEDISLRGGHANAWPVRLAEHNETGLLILSTLSLLLISAALVVALFTSGPDSP